jgi:filamentous hemagglutinin
MATGLNAGFIALQSQAAVALVNNGGDLGKTLEALGKEESIKNLLTVMVTAGALNALGNSTVFNGQSGTAASGTNGIITGQAANQFTNNLLKNVTNNVAGAAIDSAISGKALDEKTLTSALSSALITAGMAHGANTIGDARVDDTLNDFTQKVAHAALGCAGGAAIAGNGGSCRAGAVGAVVGELAADYYRQNHSTPTLGIEQNNANALAFAKVLSATSGVIVGAGGANVAAVNVANTSGANAAANNYLYHYKGKIIARDSKNNDKVIDLAASDLQSIAAQEQEVLTKEIAGLQSNNINLPKISDAWAGNVPNSTTYDLDSAKDRNTLQGKTDMGYINIDNAKTHIYVQTGMKTQLEDAQRNARIVSDVMRAPVGAIVNGTQGFAGDVDKFLPNNATLSDALNEYTYRTLNDKGPTLIITHSAGNNDATKAMQLGAQLGNTYPNLSLMSLASPIPSSVIKTASGNTGVNYLGQINDWRDPVTNPTLWVIGTGAMLAGGAAAGVALAPATGGGSLYVYGSALMGGGLGGGAIVSGINYIHPFPQYIAKPATQSIMFDWLKNNPQGK